MTHKKPSPRTTNNPQARYKKAIAKSLSYIYAHKVLTIVGISVVAFISLIGSYKYADYREQFSLKDYRSLSATARDVITTASNGEIAEKHDCSYVSEALYQQPRLFCSVKMVSYIKYENDQQAADIGKRFDTAITRSFTKTIGSFSEFYNMPNNNSATRTVILTKPYPSEHCNFYIASKRMAQAIYDFERKTEDHLIALSFECSGKSRGEYYPVTYRQGY